jgi:hypothetical protein
MKTPATRCSIQRQARQLSLPGGLILLLLLCILPVQRVAAHGEGRTLHLSDVDAGSFRLTAWTVPARLRTGEIHVEMTVRSGADRPIWDHLLIQVVVRPTGSPGQPLTTLARPAGQPAGAIYEAAFVLQQPGHYRVDVTIWSAQGLRGTATFPIEVVQVTGFTKSLIYVQLLMSFMVAGWFLKEGRRVWFGKGNPTKS